MTNNPPTDAPPDQPVQEPMAADQPQASPEQETGADRGWLDEAEGALDRVAKALTAAWEATRDTRMSALDSAKLSVKQLGEAIDKGAETARTRWQKEHEEAPSAASPPADPKT